MNLTFEKNPPYLDLTFSVFCLIFQDATHIRYSLCIFLMIAFKIIYKKESYYLEISHSNICKLSKSTKAVIIKISK